MGTKKGQKRKTARRAYEPKRNGQTKKGRAKKRAYRKMGRDQRKGVAKRVTGGDDWLKTAFSGPDRWMVRAPTNTKGRGRMWFSMLGWQTTHDEAHNRRAERLLERKGDGFGWSQALAATKGKPSGNKKKRSKKARKRRGRN